MIRFFSKLLTTHYIGWARDPRAFLRVHVPRACSMSKRGFPSPILAKKVLFCLYYLLGSLHNSVNRKKPWCKNSKEQKKLVHTKSSKPDYMRDLSSKPRLMGGQHCYVLWICPLREGLHVTLHLQHHNIRATLRRAQEHGSTQHGFLNEATWSSQSSKSRRHWNQASTQNHTAMTWPLHPQAIWNISTSTAPSKTQRHCLSTPYSQKGASPI